MTGPSSAPPVGQENSGWIWLESWAFFWRIHQPHPCVYPLLPVTISILWESAAILPEAIGLGSRLYTSGLAVMNSMLGVFAALSGRCGGRCAKSAHHIGLPPSWCFFHEHVGYWDSGSRGRLPRCRRRTRQIFGCLFRPDRGLVAAPCSALVVGLRVGAARETMVWVHVFSPCALTGAALSCASSPVASNASPSGEWMLWVRKVMGWVLVGMAAFFVRSLISDTWGTVLLCVTALAAGAHLGWIDSSTAGFRAFGWIKKAVGILAVGMAAALALSIVMEGRAVQWQPYSEKTLAEAKMSGKPVIVDFSADWCIPCRRMEKYTFHDSSVVEAPKIFRDDTGDRASGDKEKEKLVPSLQSPGVRRCFS